MTDLSCSRGCTSKQNHKLKSATLSADHVDELECICFTTWHVAAPPHDMLLPHHVTCCCPPCDMLLPHQLKCRCPTTWHVAVPSCDMTCCCPTTMDITWHVAAQPHDISLQWDLLQQLRIQNTLMYTFWNLMCVPQLTPRLPLCRDLAINYWLKMVKRS